MYTIIESEKVGKVWRDTVLYSGDNPQAYHSTLHFETKCYHSIRTIRKDGKVTSILTVNN